MCGQREEEGASLAWLRIDPDPAAMLVNDASHNGESEPRPSIFSAVDLEELVKNVFPCIRGNANPLVGPGRHRPAR